MNRAHAVGCAYLRAVGGCTCGAGCAQCGRSADGHADEHPYLPVPSAKLLRSSLSEGTQGRFLDLGMMMLDGAKVVLRLAEAWGLASEAEQLKDRVATWRDSWAKAPEKGASTQASSTTTSGKSAPSA
jgi:hypothetical protein